jgi:hypothetical protein
MTRYTVTATRRAEDDLAQLWLRASDRPAISQAANRIDQVLSENPSTMGFQAIRGMRQLIVSPLIVEFTVEEDDRLVTIWSVRHIGELTNGH